MNINEMKSVMEEKIAKREYAPVVCEKFDDEYAEIIKAVTERKNILPETEFSMIEQARIERANQFKNLNLFKMSASQKINWMLCRGINAMKDWVKANQLGLVVSAKPISSVEMQIAVMFGRPYIVAELDSAMNMLNAFNYQEIMNKNSINGILFADNMQNMMPLNTESARDYIAKRFVDEYGAHCMRFITKTISGYNVIERVTMSVNVEDLLHFPKMQKDFFDVPVTKYPGEMLYRQHELIRTLQDKLNKPVNEDDKNGYDEIMDLLRVRNGDFELKAKVNEQLMKEIDKDRKQFEYEADCMKIKSIDINSTLMNREYVHGALIEKGCPMKIDCCGIDEEGNLTVRMSPNYMTVKNWDVNSWDIEITDDDCNNRHVLMTSKNIQNLCTMMIMDLARINSESLSINNRYMCDITLIER